MAVKDLSGLLTPNLELKVGEKTYVVTPPSKDDGKVLLAINIAGVQTYTASLGVCEVCGRSGDAELDADTKALLEASRGRDLGELSLQGAYEQMVAELDGPLLQKLELYGMYYWVLGEAFADEWLANVGNGAAPKALSQRLTGRSTGSGKSSDTRKTGRRSTPTTDSRKKSLSSPRNSSAPGGA